MNPKIRFIFTCLVVYSTFAFSQDDVYKLFLKHSSVSVHAAQKRMMASGKTDMGGQLAKAVLLQSHALILYKEKKESEAVCSSALARKIAGEIIKSITGKDDNYAQLTTEDKKLMNTCGTETEIYNAGKNAMKKLPGKDTDYTDPRSLNSSNIDF